MDKLPFAPAHRSGEPPTAYASRIAAAYGLEAKELCGDFGVLTWHLANGTDAAVERITALGGADRDDLAAHAFVRTAAKEFRYRGQLVRNESLIAGRLDVCLRCLAEDAARAESDANTACFYRADWSLDVVDTCPVHCCAMTTVHKGRGAAYSFDFSNLLAPVIGGLGAMAERAVSREPTALQDYVLARLEGHGANVPLLDAMPLFAAIRSCEMLGTAACFGREAQRDQLDAARLRAARIEGFGIASRGEEGIKELLGNMTADYMRRRTRVTAQIARRAFAALHNYLHLNPERPSWKGQAYAPLRAVVADFIKTTFPLQVGENVLGEIVAERKLHSVASLAHEAGRNITRVKKLLLHRGIINEDQSRLPAHHIVIDAVDGEIAMRENTAALNHRDAAARLGTGRHQLRMLVEDKFIEPIASSPLNMRATFAPATLDAFIIRLLKGARTVKRKTENQATLHEASRQAICTQTDIVSLILDGRLKWIATLGRKRNFGSILVDPREVDTLVHGLGDKTLSVCEFAERFDLKKAAAYGLVKHGYVKVARSKRAGHRVARIPFAEADAFQRSYISLGELSLVRGEHHMTVRSALERKGISPAFEPGKVNTYFYRRADVRP